MSRKPTSPQSVPDAEGRKGLGGAEHYRLRLYIAGQTPKSLAAIANLNRLCETHLPGCHSIEVIDLLQNPEAAAADQVLALPTLVRRLPPPIKRIIGTLADVDKVLVGLEIRPAAPHGQ